MLNQKIIEEFQKLLKQIKLELDINPDNYTNRFRLQNITRSLKIIQNYPTKIKDGNELKDIKGIGKGTVDRINEIIKNGKLEEIKSDLLDKNKYLKYIEDLEEVFGIGRKTAFNLIKKFNIKSVNELKELVKNKKIELPPNILKGLKYYGKYKENIPRKEMDSVNNYLSKTAKKIDPDLFVVLCGSYRRLRPTSNDIDVLILHPKNPENILEKFITFLIKDKFIIESLTDIGVKTKYMGLCKPDTHLRRIDIRYIPYDSYYYALLYFTGSKDFNQKMRQVAMSFDMTLNEYGLYDSKNRFIKAKSEKDIFDYLGIEYVDPELR